MSKEDSNQKATLPKLVKLDRAFKLAEQWVSNMSKFTEDESTEVGLQGRLPRLGLGATAPRQSKVHHSNEPVERKLLSKLNIAKRKAANSIVESTSLASDGRNDDDGDDEEDLDSRTNAFAKKRVLPLTSTVQAKKKRRK